MLNARRSSMRYPSSVAQRQFHRLLQDLHQVTRQRLCQRYDILQAEMTNEVDRDPMVGEHSRSGLRNRVYDKD